MIKTGLRDTPKLAAIKLEWWPGSDWNRWPPSSESATPRAASVKTWRASANRVAACLDRSEHGVRLRWSETHALARSGLFPRSVDKTQSHRRPVSPATNPPHKRVCEYYGCQRRCATWTARVGGYVPPSQKAQVYLTIPSR